MQSSRMMQMSLRLPPIRPAWRWMPPTRPAYTSAQIMGIRAFRATEATKLRRVYAGSPRVQNVHSGRNSLKNAEGRPKSRMLVRTARMRCCADCGISGQLVLLLLPSPTIENGAHMAGWGLSACAGSSMRAIIARRYASERPILSSWRISAKVRSKSCTAASE
jgi:hypothetical protein